MRGSSGEVRDKDGISEVIENIHDASSCTPLHMKSSLHLSHTTTSLFLPALLRPLRTASPACAHARAQAPCVSLQHTKVPIPFLSHAIALFVFSFSFLHSHTSTEYLSSLLHEAYVSFTVVFYSSSL